MKRLPSTLALKFALLSLLLITNLGFSGQAVAAQTTSEPGIDLIILLDQSGSMSNPEANAPLPPTDPEERRIYAAQYLLDYLAFDNTLINPQRINRAVVIGFGSPSRTHLLVPLTSLKDRENVGTAKELIASENLGDTSFISGLELVRQVFPAGTDAEIDTNLRQRLIIIITDGGPVDQRKLSYAEYFDEIADYYKEQLGQENYPLYVVGVDDFNVFWPDVVDHWNTIASSDLSREPHAFRVNSIDEVNKQIVAFLCPFLGKTGVDRDCRLQEIGFHYIEPYAYRATFSFFKYQDNAEVTLTRPGENIPINTNPRDPDLIDHRVLSVRDELYVFGNPAPGCWQSARAGQGKVDVFTDVAFQNFLDLISPNNSHPQLLPLNLVFTVTDENGIGIKEDPLYPVDFDAVLIAPDGRQQSIEVEKSSNIDGQYHSTNVLETLIVGTYTVSLKGLVTIDPIPGCTTGGIRQLFEASFIIEVYAPETRVISPDQPFLQYRPLERLQVGIVDPSSGANLLLPTDTPWTAEINLTSPSGNVTVLPTPVLTNGLQEVGGPLLLPEEGQYTVSLIAHGPDGRPFYEGQSILEATHKVLLLEPPTGYPLFTPIPTVTVQLQDDQGNPYLPDPDYPLSLEAELVGPGGTVQTVSLEPAIVDARYYGSTDWSLQEAYDYTVRITGFLKLAPAPGSTEQIAFRSEFTLVGSNALPYFQVKTPSQGKSITENIYALHGRVRELFRPTPMRVEVALLHGGEIAPAEQVFRDEPNKLFTLTILDASGQTILTGIPLQPVEGQSGVFATTLDQLIVVGDYQAQVYLSGTLRDGQPYSGFVPDVVVPFRLIETPLYQAVRITFFILSSVFILALIAYLIFRIWLLAPPFPRGTLVAVEQDIVGGKEIASFDLNRRRKKVVYWSTHLPILTKLKHWLLGRMGTTSKHIDDLQLGYVEITHTTRNIAKQKEDGVEVKAYDQKGQLVAQGKLFPSKQGTLGGPPARANKTAKDDKKYSFWYRKNQ